MQILICPGNFNCVVKDLMTELKDQLSIVYPHIIYTKHTIYIRPDIEIRFVPPFVQCVRGKYPDYYWTNSNDVDTYFKHRHGVKELKTFSEVVYVVLEKRMSKIVKEE